MCNDLMICSNVEVSESEVVLIPNREVKNLTNTGTYRLVIASNVSSTAAARELACFIWGMMTNNIA